MPSSQDHERTPLLPTSLLPSSSELRQINVFDLIHSVHAEIVRAFDSALSWEQILAPDVNFSVLRPLLSQWTATKNPALIYALLLNRVQFLRLAESDLSFSALQSSRADLCEVLAIKLTRHHASNDLELVTILSRPWNPYQGAPASVLKDVDMEDIEEEMQNSLELAITASAKHFLATPLLQRVIGLIHSGQIVYHLSLASKRALLSDSYKSRRVRDREPRGEDGGEHGVYLYDTRDAGWMDHSRLKVPFYRDLIELVNFFLLFVAFIVVINDHDLARVNLAEAVFLLLSAGLLLDEFAASREHGLTFYLSSLFNGFDLGFLGIVLAYTVIRIHGLQQHPPNLVTAELAFDTLACGAVLLFPRLAFTFVQGNVLLIALKKMLRDFALFMGFAAVTFSGFFFALQALGSEWTSKSIIWLLAQVWFGSSYLSFQSSASFHPIFGPILLISYAALCSTLLLTILISILSNDYAFISQNSSEEKCFQSAISTVGGVKGDAIFSYIIPLNIPAAMILGPLSFVLTPRAFHRTNVFLIRVSTFPLLIGISLYERWQYNARMDTHGPTGAVVENIYETIVGSASDWVDEVFDNSPFTSSYLHDRSLDLQRSLTTPPTTAGPAGSSTSTAVVPSGAVGTPPIPSSSTAQSTQSPAKKIPPPAALRRRKISDLNTSPSNTSRGAGMTSPLAKLFGRGMISQEPEEEADATTDEGKAYDEDKQREVLKEELGEMKERMERMELLLMTLTKGIRSDSM